MKKLSLQNAKLSIVLFTALIGASSYTSSALAEKTLGSLGTKLTAVDVYKSTCSKKTSTSPATTAFIARIRAINGSLVNLKLKKGVKVASVVTDPKKGDAIFGPFATIKSAGEGIYIMTVSKRAVGVTSYEIQTFCNTSVKDVTAVGGFKHSKQVGPTLTQNQ